MGRPNSILYFTDDDNVYDGRLIPEMVKIRRVGVWPVGHFNKVGISTPKVDKSGNVWGYYDKYLPRKFPLDMASFAVNMNYIMMKKNTTDVYAFQVHRCINGRTLESQFLDGAGFKMEELEPLASQCKELYAWHRKTRSANVTEQYLTELGSHNRVES